MRETDEMNYHRSLISTWDGGRKTKKAFGLAVISSSGNNTSSDAFGDVTQNSLVESESLAPLLFGGEGLKANHFAMTPCNARK